MNPLKEVSAVKKHKLELNEQPPTKKRKLNLNSEPKPKSSPSPSSPSILPQDTIRELQESLKSLREEKNNYLSELAIYNDSSIKKEEITKKPVILAIVIRDGHDSEVPIRTWALNEWQQIKETHKNDKLFINELDDTPEQIMSKIKNFFTYLKKNYKNHGAIITYFGGHGNVYEGHEYLVFGSQSKNYRGSNILFYDECCVQQLLITKVDFLNWFNISIGKSPELREIKKIFVINACKGVDGIDLNHDASELELKEEQNKLPLQWIGQDAENDPKGRSWQIKFDGENFTYPGLSSKGLEIPKTGVDSEPFSKTFLSHPDEDKWILDATTYGYPSYSSYLIEQFCKSLVELRQKKAFLLNDLFYKTGNKLRHIVKGAQQLQLTSTVNKKVLVKFPK